jgi:ArsR family transcriptional regulator
MMMPGGACVGTLADGAPPGRLCVAASGGAATATARFFRVFGGATRLRLLQLLLEGGEMPVGELVAAVGQLQPRVSTHLACLRHCGFAVTELPGREVRLRLAVDGLDALPAQASAAMTPISERLATCTRIGPDRM